MTTKGNPAVAVRVAPEVLDDWKAAAARQGVSLAEFIRVSVDRALVLEAAGGRIVKPEPTPLHTPASAAASKRQAPKAGRNRQTAARASRAQVCARQRHHRAGVYCRECGTTP